MFLTFYYPADFRTVLQPILHYQLLCVSHTSHGLKSAAFYGNCYVSATVSCDCYVSVKYHSWRTSIRNYLTLSAEWLISGNGTTSKHFFSKCTTPFFSSEWKCADNAMKSILAIWMSHISSNIFSIGQFIFHLLKNFLLHFYNDFFE